MAMTLRAATQRKEQLLNGKSEVMFNRQAKSNLHCRQDLNNFVQAAD
jgi:hypothetical protein